MDSACLSLHTCILYRHVHSRKDAIRLHRRKAIGQGHRCSGGTKSRKTNGYPCCHIIEEQHRFGAWTMSSNRKQKLKKRKQKEQRRAARQKEAYERLAKIYRQVLTALRLDSLYRDLPAYDRSCIETTRVTALRILTAHQKSNWMPSTRNPSRAL